MVKNSKKKSKRQEYHKTVLIINKKQKFENVNLP